MQVKYNRPYHGFRRHLDGQAKRSETIVFVWESDSKYKLLPKLNFTQFVNHNVKILGRRLYSPSLKDVAWLEDIQFIFLIFHTFLISMHLDFANGTLSGMLNEFAGIRKVSWPRRNAASYQPRNLNSSQVLDNFFHTFVCKFGWVDERLDAVRGKKNYRQMYGKFKKLSSAASGKATSFKLGEYNLPPSVLTF